MKYFQEILLEEDFNMFGQSDASMVKHLPTLYEALSLLPSIMYKNKAQQMLGQEGKGTEKRTGIWPQVDAINTIL